jgi:hypothetical protein
VSGRPARGEPRANEEGNFPANDVNEGGRHVKGAVRISRRAGGKTIGGGGGTIRRLRCSLRGWGGLPTGLFGPLSVQRGAGRNRKPEAARDLGILGPSFIGGEGRGGRGRRRLSGRCVPVSCRSAIQGRTSSPRFPPSPRTTRPGGLSMLSRERGRGGNFMFGAPRGTGAAVSWGGKLAISPGAAPPLAVGQARGFRGEERRHQGWGLKPQGARSSAGREAARWPFLSPPVASGNRGHSSPPPDRRPPPSGGHVGWGGVTYLTFFRGIRIREVTRGRRWPQVPIDPPRPSRAETSPPKGDDTGRGQVRRCGPCPAKVQIDSPGARVWLPPGRARFPGRGPVCPSTSAARAPPSDPPPDPPGGWRDPDSPGGPSYVSEMSWVAPQHAETHGRAGDQNTARCCAMTTVPERYRSGRNNCKDDPWSTVGTTYEVAQVGNGRVTRVAEFGAFVELEPGIEGWRMPYVPSYGPAWRLRPNLYLGYNWCLRKSQRPTRTEAHWRRNRPGRIVTSRWCHDTTGRIGAPARSCRERERHERFGVFFVFPVARRDNLAFDAPYCFPKPAPPGFRDQRDLVWKAFFTIGSDGWEGSWVSGGPPRWVGVGPAPRITPLTPSRRAVGRAANSAKQAGSSRTPRVLNAARSGRTATAPPGPVPPEWDSFLPRQAGENDPSRGSV